MRPQECLTKRTEAGKSRFLFMSYSEDLSNKQRFLALKNAFNTIRHFAEPSCTPTQMYQFEELEKSLLEIYKCNLDLESKIINGEYK